MKLPQGACLGVVGGGQLGRYFVLAARRLGFRTAVLDPDADAPAMQLGDTVIVAAYDDAQALDRLAELCDAITLEFENVPAAALERLQRSVPVAPRPEHVAVAQDRRLEKRLAADNGLETADWVGIDSAEQAAAVAPERLPGILKTARLGYDGKGQTVCRTAQDVVQAWHAAGEVACVLETQLLLQVELSVIVARGADGETALFPPARNVHRDGILHTSTVPSGLPAALVEQACEQTRALAEAIDYVGVLAVEFFVVEGTDGMASLVFNELAPRPHNSGHWTLDAAQSCQFEQQVRALAGWPLAGTAALTPVAMLNLLGDAPLAQRVAAAVARPGAALHLYGKREARSGRKMGHVNCLADSVDDAVAMAQELHAAAD